MNALTKTETPCGKVAANCTKPKRRALDHLLQHGFDWSDEDLTGWDLSEKMNGVRAYWDGFELWTRGANCIALPPRWRDALPVGIPLDCELYHGNDGLYRCVTAARYGRFMEGMELVCFDAPSLSGHWRERMEQAENFCQGKGIIRTVPRWVAASTAHALQLKRRIQMNGGEGLIARSPTLKPAPGRTALLLKLKGCTA